MEPKSNEEGAGGKSKSLDMKNNSDLPDSPCNVTNKNCLSSCSSQCNDVTPSSSRSSHDNGDKSFDNKTPEKGVLSKKIVKPEKVPEVNEPEQNNNGTFSGNSNKTQPSNNSYSSGNQSFKQQQFQYTEAPRKEYNSKEEYFADLRQWLQQAYFWQSVSAAFPYFMMCQHWGQLSLQNSGSSVPLPTNLRTNGVPFSFPGLQNQQSQALRQRTEVIDGVECRIPSFWKRIAAEFIDFLILLLVKVMVTYVAVDFFNFVDMDAFDIFQKDVKLAYKTFIQITQDIVILEMIHRLVVCAFETFWLIGGQNGRIGGSTPGKNLMGLRVLLCESSSALREGDDRIIVRPGTNLGLGPSFLRALTKNFVLALLIPTSFAFIFFPHNRTGYDMICNSIVVEEPVVPHRVHRD